MRHPPTNEQSIDHQKAKTQSPERTDRHPTVFLRFSPNASPSTGIIYFGSYGMVLLSIDTL
jgi:hypothetical protein